MASGSLIPPLRLCCFLVECLMLTAGPFEAIFGWDASSSRTRIPCSSSASSSATLPSAGQTSAVCCLHDRHSVPAPRPLGDESLRFSPSQIIATGRGLSASKAIYSKLTMAASMTLNFDSQFEASSTIPTAATWLLFVQLYDLTQAACRSAREEDWQAVATSSLEEQMYKEKRKHTRKAGVF